MSIYYESVLPTDGQLFSFRRRKKKEETAASPVQQHNASKPRAPKPTGFGTHVFFVNQEKFEVDVRYEFKKFLGRGTYGVVASCHDTVTGKDVAVKKVKAVFDNAIMTKRLLREIKIMRFLQHENIVHVLDLMRSARKSKDDFQDVYIVMPLMSTDLDHIIRSQQILTDQHVQYLMFQLLSAMHYLHSADLVHRDLKPANILVNSACELRVCDFGLARHVDENEMDLTMYVVTRWYRAPELIINNTKYTSAIDMWSVGCILAEMLGRTPLFPGNDPAEQIELITKVLGTPTDEDLSSFEQSDGVNFLRNLPFCAATPLNLIYDHASDMSLDLLQKLLKYDHATRMTASEALQHPYFKPFQNKKLVTAPKKFNEIIDESTDMAQPTVAYTTQFMETLRKEICKEISMFRTYSDDLSSKRQIVGTAFSENVKVVVSFAPDDKSLAEYAVRYAQSYAKAVRMESSNEDDPNEIRICLCTKKYEALESMKKLASMAATRNQLAIAYLRDDMEEDDEDEDWEQIYASATWFVRAHDKNDWKFAVHECVDMMRRVYSQIVRVADYTILKDIGKESQSVVYMARNDANETVENREICAMKQFPKSRINQVKVEAAIMKKLRHESVVQFMQLIEAPEYVFIVMEYCEGGSLYSDADVLNGHIESLPLARVQNICQQLVSGLVYIHDMGVLHRDIKPSNVLGHREHGTVKFSDFGVSSFMNMDEKSRALGKEDLILVGSNGTPAFLPPEAFGVGGKEMYHGRLSDVWALGVTFYVLLFQKHPFLEDGEDEMIRLICSSSKVEFPSNSAANSKIITGLLKNMMNKDPKKRFSLNAIRKHSWILV